MARNVEKKINEIIIEQLKVQEDECVPKAFLIDDLRAVPLDVIELAMTVEDNFDIKIMDKDLEKIRTVQDLIDCIKQKVS